MGRRERALAEFPDCRGIAQTPMALLVKFPDREEPVWVSQSVIHDDSEVYKKNSDGTLIVYESWAIDKGLV